MSTSVADDKPSDDTTLGYSSSDYWVFTPPYSSDDAAHENELTIFGLLSTDRTSETKRPKRSIIITTTIGQHNHAEFESESETDTRRSDLRYAKALRKPCAPIQLMQ